VRRDGHRPAGSTLGLETAYVTGALSAPERAGRNPCSASRVTSFRESASSSGLGCVDGRKYKTHPAPIGYGRLFSGWFSAPARLADVPLAIVPSAQ